MKTVIPDYFHQFRCLAGACPDTCCGPWEIVIDDDTAEVYRTMEGPLGEQLRKHLTSVDGEACFVPIDGRCPMLTADGLCPIITAHGTEALSITCDAHPRFTEVYGGYQETALSVSCPEAARLLLERMEPLTFLTEQDATPPEPNDLDADLFFLLLHTRDTAYALVQDRRLPLSDRLALLLCFAERLDKHYDNYDLCSHFSDLYRNPNYQRRQLTRIRRLRKYGTLIPARQVFHAMEHLTEEFPKQLRDLEWVAVDTHAVPLEQLTMYYLSRWWLKAVCDGYIRRQAAACVLSVLTVAGLTRTMGDVQLAARLYSKEVEHSADNLALLRRAMDLPHFSRNELLKLLEVPHAI